MAWPHARYDVVRYRLLRLEVEQDAMSAPVPAGSIFLKAEVHSSIRPFAVTYWLVPDPPEGS